MLHFGKHRRNYTDARESRINLYYEKISAALGILQVVIYLALFSFVVLSFLKNTSLITYQNFYYFFKDLNASAEAVDVFASDSVSYPTAEEQSFALYRNGLAVAGNQSVTVFTATGRQTVSQSIHYKNPIAVGAGKYLLVYELGGTQYSVYNSYTQLHMGTSDFPILGATVSDSGSFALISRSESANCTVSFYSDQFKLLRRYHRSGFVMGASLDEQGEHLAMLISTASDGRFVTRLELCDVRDEDEDSMKTVEISDSLALSCHFMNNGVGVLCENGFTFVASDGREVAEIAFSGSHLAACFMNEEYAAFCLENAPLSDEKQIIVFDKRGKMVYNETTKDRLIDLVVCDGVLFYYTAEEICRLELSNLRSERMAYSVGERRILAVDSDEILLCSPQKAEFIRFDAR